MSVTKCTYVIIGIQFISTREVQDRLNPVAVWSSQLSLPNVTEAIYPSFSISWLMPSDKSLSKEEVQSQSRSSLTLPCYQQIIIHSHPPLCFQPSIPLFHRAPRAAATPSLCSWRYTAAVPLTYKAKPLFPCSSTHNLLLSLLHGNSCSNTCSPAFCVSLYFTLAYAGLIIWR